MEDVPFCQTQQILQIMWSQYVHVVDVQWLLQVFIHLRKESLLYKRVRYPAWGLSVVWFVGCILHETVHNVVALRAQCLIEDGRNCQVQEWSQAHSLLPCLIVAVFKGLQGITIDMDCTLQQLVRRDTIFGECFEFWEFLKGEVDFCCSPIVLNMLKLIVCGFLQYFLRLFCQLEECNSVSAIRQDYLRLNDSAISQLNSHRFLIIIIDDLFHI